MARSAAVSGAGSGSGGSGVGGGDGGGEGGSGRECRLRPCTYAEPLVDAQQRQPNQELQGGDK